MLNCLQTYQALEEQESENMSTILLWVFACVDIKKMLLQHSAIYFTQTILQRRYDTGIDARRCVRYGQFSRMMHANLSETLSKARYDLNIKQCICIISKWTVKIRYFTFCLYGIYHNSGHESWQPAIMLIWSRFYVSPAQTSLVLR